MGIEGYGPRRRPPPSRRLFGLRPRRAPAERIGITPAGPNVATAFETTTPACQRRKNHRKQASSFRDLSRPQVHDLRHIEGMHQSAGPPLEAHPDYIRWIKHLYGGSTGDETGKLACGATWRGYTPVDANVRDFRGSESDPGSRNDWHGARGRPLEGHPDYDKSATAICSRDREYPRCCHNRIAEFCFECGAPTAYRFAIRAGIDSDCGKVSCTELTGFSAGDVERILGARKVAFTEEQFDFMTTETRPSPIGNANWHVEELDHISPVHLLGGEMGLTPGGRPNKWAKIANR